MLLTLLSKLAAFSLKRPKTLITIVAVLALGAFAVHYKLLVSERDKLLSLEAAYRDAVAQFEAREATLQADIENERTAAATALAERNAARRSLEAFRAGRESDPEALEWAATPLPGGEIERLCKALPELVGCQNTRPNN